MFYITSLPYTDTRHTSTHASTTTSSTMMANTLKRHTFDSFRLLFMRAPLIRRVCPFADACLFVNGYISSINNPLMVRLFNAWRLKITTYMLRCFVSKQTHTLAAFLSYSFRLSSAFIYFSHFSWTFIWTNSEQVKVKLSAMICFNSVLLRLSTQLLLTLWPSFFPLLFARRKAHRLFAVVYYYLRDDVGHIFKFQIFSVFRSTINWVASIPISLSLETRNNYKL